MIYQQRPFFRKKITLPKKFLPSQANIFLNHNKFNKNVRFNKLSPHKFKRTHIKTTQVMQSPTFFKFSRFFKIIFLELSVFGLTNSLLYKNHLGIIFKAISLNGSLVNTILSQSHFYKHWFLHIDTMCYKLIGPNISACVRSNIDKKIYGLQSFKILLFQVDGTVKLNLGSAIKIFETTSFLLGVTQKFNTRNCVRISSVRGISKNPVDHPNGGRANTKGSFKTPWGTIAKANK